MGATAPLTQQLWCATMAKLLAVLLTGGGLEPEDCRHAAVFSRHEAAGRPHQLCQFPHAGTGR